MKFGFMKFSIPVGLSVLSHEVLIGIAKFAKVGSIGVLELIIPVSVFAGCIALINRFKKTLKTKQSQPLYIAPPNYDEYYSNINNNPQQQYSDYVQHDREFVVRERGVKEETFSNGKKTTVYEFERRSSTW